MRVWQLLFLFPKCVLRLQPEIRGGRKKKLKRNETLRTGLLERLKRWNEGQVNVLWAEARKLFSGGERQAVTVSLANNIRRATECAQDARYGKAVASLLSLGLCPTNDENLEAMKSKHRQRSLSFRQVHFPTRSASTRTWCARRWMVSPQVLRREPQAHGLSFSKTSFRAPTKLQEMKRSQA